jgi:hypothetical protein
MNISGHISESLEAILCGSGIRNLFLIFDSMYFFPLVRIRSKVNAGPDLTSYKKRQKLGKFGSTVIKLFYIFILSVHPPFKKWQRCAVCLNLPLSGIKSGFGMHIISG